LVQTYGTATDYVGQSMSGLKVEALQLHSLYCHSILVMCRESSQAEKCLLNIANHCQRYCVFRLHIFDFRIVCSCCAQQV